MSDFELCLLDCQSIQQYVFGSNKLQTNIGASKNVEATFKDTFKKVLGSDFQLDDWRSEPDKIKIFKDDKPLVDVGYIGGGNALLIFRTDGAAEPAKEFVQKWSRQVLLDFPGIVPAAIIRGPFEEKALDEQIKNAFENFPAQKNKGIPVTILSRHGITAECKQTGLSAEIFNNKNKKESKWVSSVSKAKIETGKSETARNDGLAYNEEQLGQENAQNHIAVIHIDGNSMGQQFMQCETLGHRRKLSAAVSNATKQAWQNLIDRFDVVFTNEKKQDIIKFSKDENDKTVKPLRKIILNGDDLTFVCNAKIAFWLTENYLKALAKQPLEFDGVKLLDKNGKEIRMSACAGISIVKTKFPFYRAYQLAEELCSSAKEMGRENRESWIDFEIVYGGLSGNLKDIRKKKYRVGNDLLLWRPWRVLDNQGQICLSNDSDWEQLKKTAMEFAKENNGASQWPRSKRKELLQKLTQGPQATEDYAMMLSARGLPLPNFSNNNGAWRQWDDKKINLTPYFDILQVSEFYPKELLAMEAK